VGSLGTSLLAWLLFPAAGYLLFVGTGLLAERAARLQLPNVLLGPVGLCATVVLVMPLYWTGAGAWLATPAAVVAAAAGYALARGTIRSRLNPGGLGLAALAAYLLVLAPVLAAGGWTWTGYNFVNDTAVQLLLADHLAHHGVTAPLGPPEAEPQSTGLEHIRIYLDSGYPLGTHALLATLRPLGLAPFEAVYQPLIALFAAMATLSLGWLLQRVASIWLAATGALVAVAANLVYQYGLQGSVKEIGMVAVFAAAVAVTRHALAGRIEWRAGALIGLLLGACVLVYSTAALPYVGALGALAVVAVLVQRRAAIGRRDLVRVAPVALVVAVIAALPALPHLVRFGEVAEQAFTEESSPQVDLAHLLRPLKLSQTAGVWLKDDYRAPVVGDIAVVNDLLIALVFVLAVVGFAYLARRRDPGIFMYAIPAALALAFVSPRVSSYADAKLLVLLTPAVVALAWAGVAWVASRSRPAAVVLALLVAGGVLWSDALAYHRVQLAPVDRLEALEDIGERYQGKGLMLVNDFEQFAKYFMRDARENVAAEAITPRFASDLPVKSFVNMQIDVDQEGTDYLAFFPWIVERKGGDASRPPADYRLEYENRFYTVWGREEGTDVVRHEPLQGRFVGAKRLPCDKVLDYARAAAPGEEFAVSLRPRGVRLDTAHAARSQSWQPHSYVKDAVVTEEPGQASGRRFFDGGRYRIWVLGSFGRDIAVLVDGREVGRVRGVNTDGEWLDGGVVEVPRGRHEIELRRGGGSLAPGDGYKGVLGPLVFQPVFPTESLVWVKPGEIRRRVCGRDLDWMELVRR